MDLMPFFHSRAIFWCNSVISVNFHICANKKIMQNNNSLQCSYVIPVL